MFTSAHVHGCTLRKNLICNFRDCCHFSGNYLILHNDRKPNTNSLNGKHFQMTSSAHGILRMQIIIWVCVCVTCALYNVHEWSYQKWNAFWKLSSNKLVFFSCSYAAKRKRNPPNLIQTCCVPVIVAWPLEHERSNVTVCVCNLQIIHNNAEYALHRKWKYNNCPCIRS